MNKKNVVSKIKFLIRKNPNQGTFVNWRGLDSLKNFSEKNPELAYYLIVNLFNEEVELSTRIESFKEIVKKYDKDCFLGTSLFAYLMSAFDSHNYTIYKNDFFKNFVIYLIYKSHHQLVKNMNFI